MTDYSPEQLKKRRAKEARKMRDVGRVLVSMRGGQALHQHLDQYGRRWTLTNGTFVNNEVAAVVVNHCDVIDCGDALFEGAPSQTYRYADGAKW